jgi:C4-dicarboxylate-specific signal transduction histidine kinase
VLSGQLAFRCHRPSRQAELTGAKRGSAKVAFRQIAADGHRAEAVIESIRASLKQQNRIRALLDVNHLIGEALANAVDSMPVEDGPRVLCVSSEVRDGDEVVVSVADTGTGIGSQDIQRVFNPLFTTKSGGMGLGLSICRSIIEGHHGKLGVVPNTPKGAVFQIALRAHSADAAI